MKIAIKHETYTKHQIAVFKLTTGLVVSPTSRKAVTTKMNVNPKLDIFGGTERLWYAR